MSSLSSIDPLWRSNNENELLRSFREGSFQARFSCEIGLWIWKRCAVVSARKRRGFRSGLAQYSDDYNGESIGAEAATFPCQSEERHFYFHAGWNEPRRYFRSQA